MLIKQHYRDVIINPKNLTHVFEPIEDTNKGFWMLEMYFINKDKQVVTYNTKEEAYKDFNIILRSIYQ
jgi:hypothetical protein